MESSPIHQLVLPWWQSSQRRRLHEIPAMREALMQAAIEELRDRAARGASYNPFGDIRVQWAAQYLAYQENPKFQIDPDTKACAALFFNKPLTPCGKDMAAGVH